jgi:hypothetical protein
MNWLQNLKEAAPETKWFIFNWFFYGLLTVGTLIYCYARLDFVRTGPTTTSHLQEKK